MKAPRGTGAVLGAAAFGVVKCTALVALLASGSPASDHPANCTECLQLTLTSSTSSR